MKDTVRILKLDHFGRGVAQVNGKTLFVENALDGEVVDVVYDEKKRILESSSCGFISKSLDRRDAICPYYGSCGGCNIMHMNYLKQLDFKKHKVYQLLRKFAGINQELIEDVIPTVEFNYRNKVTLKVKEKVGFYKNKSYIIVNVDKCVICSNKINALIEKLNTLNLEGISEIVIRSNYKDDSMVIITGSIDKDYFIKNLKDCTDNLVLINEEKVELLFGEGSITEKVGDLYFKISPLSFFQVNTIGAEKLYDVVKEFADLSGNESVLDLYCGTGTIGMYLSGNAKSVVGIEINKDAINDANNNVSLNNINNCKYICDDVGRALKNYNDIDLIIVDPPRNGLSVKALNDIINVNSKKIIYISCDPATLARDLNILKETYDVKKIKLVDMFPNTYHCESVVILERK